MQVEVNFHIYNTRQSINNHTQYTIRRQISQIFENSEFGRSEEVGNSKFLNVFAVPINDNYIEENNEIFIAYVFPLPLTHGNLGVLIIQEIPRFHDWITNNHPDINCVSHIIYS